MDAQKHICVYRRGRGRGGFSGGRGGYQGGQGGGYQGNNQQGTSGSSYQGGSGGGGGRQVFVSNLPWKTSWHDLKDLFRECGEVIRYVLRHVIVVMIALFTCLRRYVAIPLDCPSGYFANPITTDRLMH